MVDPFFIMFVLLFGGALFMVGYTWREWRRDLLKIRLILQKWDFDQIRSKAKKFKEANQELAQEPEPVKDDEITF